MPFVTEELWEKTGEAGPPREKLLMLSGWPDLRGREDAAAQSELEWLIALVSGIRSVRTEMNVPAGAKTALRVIGAGAETGNRIETHLAAIKRLARVEGVDYASEVPRGSAQIVLDEATFALPLAGVIDIGAEKARLEREIKKIDEDVEKIDKKLGNPQFVAKAPPEVIEEQRQRRDEAMARREKLVAALERLR
jgi:valyl-tRNA synthetase